MSDEIRTRVLDRVRQQFHSNAIDIAWWDISPSNVRIPTYIVSDPIVAARMRDRRFRVVSADHERAPELLDPQPADDRGVEMFGRLCLWGLCVVLALTAATVWWVLSNGGVQ